MTEASVSYCVEIIHDDDDDRETPWQTVIPFGANAPLLLQRGDVFSINEFSLVIVRREITSNALGVPGETRAISTTIRYYCRPATVAEMTSAEG